MTANAAQLKQLREAEILKLMDLPMSYEPEFEEFGGILKTGEISNNVLATQEIAIPTLHSHGPVGEQILATTNIAKVVNVSYDKIKVEIHPFVFIIPESVHGSSFIPSVSAEAISSLQKQKDEITFGRLEILSQVQTAIAFDPATFTNEVLTLISSQGLALSINQQKPVVLIPKKIQFSLLSTTTGSSGETYFDVLNKAISQIGGYLKITSHTEDTVIIMEGTKITWFKGQQALPDGVEVVGAFKLEKLNHHFSMASDFFAIEEDDSIWSIPFTMALNKKEEPKKVDKKEKFEA